MRIFFGSYLKKLRLEKGLGLRAFAHKIGLDPSFLCNIEHGKLKHPRGSEKLLKMAKVLGLEENSDEWNMFFDLSADQPDRIPADIAGFVKALPIPLLVRTVKGKKLTKKQLMQLTSFVQENY